MSSTKSARCLRSPSYANETLKAYGVSSSESWFRAPSDESSHLIECRYVKVF